MSDKKHALAVLTVTPEKVNAVHFLKKSGKLVAKRVELIFKVEREAAFHAISLGVQLWQVKTLKPECGFQKWIEANVNERGYRSCAYYMKLAVKFAEKARLTRDECFELPTLKFKSAKGGTAKVAFDKLEKFIGENSLTDLLVKHGIRTGNGGSEIEGGGEDTPSNGAGEQLMFAEITGHLFGLRETVLKRENLMRLDPKQLDALKTEIEHTRTEFLKLYEQARGKR